MAAPVLQSAGPGNQDELLTTSLVNMLPGIRDNVFSSMPMLNYFKKKGMKKKGGAALSHGILYGTNDTAQAYQGYDILSTTSQDGLTRDQWEWRQYSASVSVDGLMNVLPTLVLPKSKTFWTPKKCKPKKAFRL